MFDILGTNAKTQNDVNILIPAVTFFGVNTSLKSDRHMGYQDGNGDVTFAG